MLAFFRSPKVIFFLLVAYFCSSSPTLAFGPQVRAYQALESQQGSDSRASGCLRTKNWLKRNLGWCVTLVGIGGTTAAVFYDQYSREKENGTSEQYSISGGCTAAIRKVIVPLICLPTARVFMSKLQGTRIGSCLGLHRRIDLHKVLAGVFAAAAVTHTACSVLGDANFLATHEGKTGVAMWSALLIPIFGSYLIKDAPCLQRVSYVSKFLRPHQLGFLVFVTAYGMHRPSMKLLPWAAAPVGELLLDRLMESCLASYESTVLDAKVEGKQVILTVSRPPGMEVKAGQFLYVEVNGSRRPFTIARFDENRLIFVISPLGPSTEELYRLVERKELPPESLVSLVGPFSSPFQAIASKGELLTVSSGSGVSAATAVLQALGEASTEEKENQGVSILHTGRSAESFHFLAEAIHDAREQGVRIRTVDLFLTGSGEGDIEAAAESCRDLREKIESWGMTLREVRSESYQNGPFEEASGGTRDVNRFGRLNDTAELVLHHGRMLVNETLIPDSSVHVVISGNPDLAKMINNYCTENGIDFTQEGFQF